MIVSLITTLLLCQSGEAPQDDLSRLDQARSAAQASRFADAEGILRAMLRQNEGDDREGRLLLAEVQIGARSFPRAAETLAPLDQPEDYEVQLLLGQSYEGEAAAQAAAGAAGQDVGYLYELAKAAYNHALKVSPQDDTRAAVGFMNLSIYQFGEHEQVLDMADVMMDEGRADGEILLMRGCAGVFHYWAAASAEENEVADTRWDQAVEDFIAADLLLGSNRHEPWAQLSWLYEQKEKSDDAVSAATKAYDLQEGSNFFTLYRLAKRYSDEGQYAVATQSLQNMVERQPDELVQWIQSEEDPTGTVQSLAYAPLMSKINKGDLRGAKPIFDSLSQADPDDAGFWNNYGLLCRDTGDYQVSLSAYRRSLALDNTDPRVTNDTAVILHYYLKENDEEARALYQRALDLANAALEEGDLDQERLAFLNEVVRDARSNLARLERGVRANAGDTVPPQRRGNRGR